MPSLTTQKVPSDAVLTLSTLGRVSLSFATAAKEDVEVLGPGKPLALLAYLVQCPSQTASRDHLIDLLWVGHDPDDARHALRQTVWYIRQRLGPKSLEVPEGAVRVAIDINSDVSRFVAAVERGELEVAIDLYQGDFLPDLAVPGGVEFDWWVESERARLRTMFYRTADVLVRGWLSRAQFPKAESLARRVRDLDLAREAGWRLLLESLTSAGDSVRAALEAGELERLLDTEEREPEPATLESIALAKETPVDRAETESGKALIAELVGREREFSAILQAWGRAEGGHGCHLTVTAAAGLGKTRLLNDVHTRLRAAGATVVHLRANPGERHIAYSFASAMAAALAGAPGAVAISPACASTLLVLNPSLASRFHAPAESVREQDLLRSRTFALSELLAAVAHEQPVVLLVDDLHWIDSSSINVLGGLAGRVGDHAVLMVAATRPTARRPIHETAAETLVLSPLTEEQIGALANSIGNLGGTSWAGRLPGLLFLATGGSPLLVIESLLLALDRRWLELGDDGWICHDEEAVTKELEAGGALRRRVEGLDRAEAWLLLLLASAGAPLDLDHLAAMTKSSEAILREDLASLEQRGFLTRFGDEYAPAHDEIADLSVETASDDAVAAANGAAGRVLAERAWDDLHSLIMAGQLLARAGDDASLRRAYRRSIWLARQRGDLRSLRELASELLANNATTKPVSKLVSSLPLPLRLGFTSVRRIAAATVLFFAAAASVIWVVIRPSPTPPEAMLYTVEFPLGETTDAHSMPVSQADWDVSTPLRLDRNGSAIPALSLAGQVRGIAARPDGEAWALVRVVEDSGVMDLFLVEDGGESRRLTFAPGDDTNPSWAPDGKQLVFRTCRWDSLCRHDIAIMDIASADVRPLLRGDTLYGPPVWSPTGERIAYSTGMGEGGPSRACWTTVDGESSRCYSSQDPYDVVRVVGWYESSHLILVVRRAESDNLALLDLGSGEFRIFEASPTTDLRGVVATAEGRWVAARGTVNGGVAHHWMVFPFDRPEMARQVLFQHQKTRRDPLASWISSTHRHHYIEEMSVVGPRSAIPLNTPYQLTATGVSPSGDTIVPAMVRWASIDSSVAVIDERGTIHPRALGTARIVASAGGWRQDSVVISIDRAAHETSFVEDWSDDSLPGWRLFGEPLPAVTTGPDGVRSFWNRGDGSFPSGAYSFGEFDGRAGLGIDVLLSAPFNHFSWQTLELGLSPQIDTVALSRWDHKLGEMPIDRRLDFCGFQLLPGNNSAANESWLLDMLQVMADLSLATVQLSGDIRSGAWHRYRLQLFPDGSCGVAVDGVPVSHLTAGVSTQRPFRIILGYGSYQTRMLHGPLEVWTGVKGDIDWRVLENGR